MLFPYDVHVAFVIHFFSYVAEDKLLKKSPVHGVKTTCLFINKEWNTEQTMPYTKYCHHYNCYNKSFFFFK